MTPYKIAGIVICFASAGFGERWLESYEIVPEREKWKARLLLFFAVLSVMGFLFFILPHYGYSEYKIMKYLILLVFLLFAAIVDRKKMLIPNPVLLVLFLLRLGLMVGESIWQPELLPSIWMESILGMIIGGGVFLLSGMIWKGSVGMGDVKLFGVVGLYMGVDVLCSMLISLILSALAGIYLMVISKRDKKTFIPMAPFAFFGTAAAILLGY